MLKTAAVVNQRAGSYSITSIERAKDCFGQNIKIIFTDYAGHATSLTKELLKSGFQHIIGIGGDGTFNEVVNGFFENGHLINPEAKFTPLLAGSSGDTLKSINAGKIDLIKCVFVDNQDKFTLRYSINMVNIGLGGKVSKLAQTLPRFTGGKINFMLSTVLSFFIYDGDYIKLNIDDRDIGEFHVLNVAIANGRYTGGGMFMSPGSRMDDGFLDVVLIKNISALEFGINIPKIYNGTHLSLPIVEAYRGKRIEINGKSRFDMDGEVPGRLPGYFELLPRVLNVIGDGS